MKITHREKEIINLIANELTTKEIAAKLFISNETVTSHRRNLMDKLKAKNVAGLVRRGFESGILRSAMGIWFMIMYCSVYTIGQETSIGLEVDVAHDVILGTTLGVDEGKHLHWSPSKSAFRVGYFDNADWSDEQTGICSIAMGCENTARGQGSMTWGNITSANAQSSTVWGYRNWVSNDATLSTIWGEENFADTELSTVWGKSNEANGVNATIWGENNEANGVNATVWGESNFAESVGSSVSGLSNRAKGNYSTVMGFGNIAKGFSSLVIGQFNDSIIQVNQNALTDDTPLFIVGNGSLFGGRNNALSVFGNGRMKLGKGAASADIHIKQSATSPDLGSGGIILEHTSNDSYWQIYYSGTHLSFMKDGVRRAYITADGEFIDAYNPAIPRIEKSQMETQNTIQDILIGKIITDTKNLKVGLNETQLAKSNTHMAIYDEDGNLIGIDYKQLYLTAIAALQEEIKINQKQQIDIDALKAAILK